MKRPAKAQLPNQKTRPGDLSFPELIDYYSQGLMVEARELLEYSSYLKGKFEVAEQNLDVATARELGEEVKWSNQRLQEVTERMTAIRKLLNLFTGGQVDV